MNIKPPKKKNERYRKHKYLIWSDEVGFLHLDSFSLEDLERFSNSIKKEISKFSNNDSKKSLTIDE